MATEIHLKRRGEPLPPLDPHSSRYVLAENGLFRERRTELFTSSCRVTHCSGGLDTHEEQCDLHCPPLTTEMARAMLAFFRWAYCTHGGEAALVLLYDLDRDEYRWHCPPQRVEVWQSWGGTWYGGTDIEYDNPLVLPPGHVIAGDAHSHSSMSAYASQTDQADEAAGKDGLHIVIGCLHRPRVEVHIDFVIDGRRFAVDPAALLPESEIPAEEEVPEEWKSQVEVIRRPYTHSTWTDPRSDSGSARGVGYRPADDRNGSDLSGPRTHLDYGSVYGYGSTRSSRLPDLPEPPGRGLPRDRRGNEENRGPESPSGEGERR